jgi:hypothetical protein
MKYYRSVALAALLAGGLAVPALAQTVSAPAPKADASTAMPDVGVKKAPTPVKHARHTHKPAKSTSAPTSAST